MRHFHTEGFAVVREALGAVARRRFVRSFWRTLQRVLPSLRVRKRETWRFPTGYRGIQAGYGLAQSDFAWVPRLAPKVQDVFAALFGVKRTELVVSLDAVLLSDSVAKKPAQAWLHKDQGASIEELSVQGIYTAGGVGERDAGTVLVPRSHKIVYDWERHIEGQHLKVPPNEMGKLTGLVIKPYVPPNSLLVFNSRLVHANAPARERRQDTQAGMPLPNRLGVAVCFAPRARRSEATRLKKEIAYFGGKTANHWPCDRFNLKRPHLWDHVRGGQKLPRPPKDPKRLALL